MRGVFAVFLAGLVLVLAAGCAVPGLLGSPETIEDVIERTKNRINPTIVFIKPIRETFESGRRTQQEIFGSGAIISPDGYVVTNCHVVEKAVRVHCVLWTREQVEAEVVGTDKDTDIALLKLQLEGDEPLPFAEFGDSDGLNEGQFVMAFGSPFGFSRTVTQGIISNTRRYIGFNTEYRYSLWIQTDAAINPGNSGGPLVNTDGEIVGINTLSIRSTGLAFAVPANVAREIIRRIRDSENGEVQRTHLGIQLQPLKDFARNTFVAGEEGVLVGGVEPGSPGAEAGIMPGDLILAVGGRPVNGIYAEDLPAIEWLLADLDPTGEIEFQVRRGESLVQLALVPRAKGRVEGENFECERWDMTVREISRFEQPGLHFYRPEGVFVFGVRHPGNAMLAGLSPADIILTVDGREITGLEEMEAVYELLIGDEQREKEVLLEVLRGGYREYVALDYRRNFKQMEEEE